MTGCQRVPSGRWRGPTANPGGPIRNWRLRCDGCKNSSDLGFIHADPLDLGPLPERVVTSRPTRAHHETTRPSNWTGGPVWDHVLRKVAENCGFCIIHYLRAAVLTAIVAINTDLRTFLQARPQPSGGISATLRTACLGKLSSTLVQSIGQHPVRGRSPLVHT